MVSERKLLLLALLAVLFGGVHTLFIVSRLSSTSVANGGPLQVSSTRNTASNATLTRAVLYRPPVAPSNDKETHAIPRILIFTHYRDLLVEKSSLTDEEEIVLAANIQKVIRLHPKSTTVRFLTDKQCIESLQKTYPSLIPYFQKEEQGMFKADICRGSALYETGGIYLDVDVGVRKDLWLDLANQTEFVTSLVHRQSHYPNHFFQAILGAAPKSPIIYKYLELFEGHYTGKERVEKGPLGVILLRRAWDRVFDKKKGTPVTELYHEVLYNKQLFPNLHPAPTWGTRRACHFVVMATANDVAHSEVSYREKHFHIPLYSRIAGSRMCPIHPPKEDEKKVEHDSRTKKKKT